MALAGDSNFPPEIAHVCVRRRGLGGGGVWEEESVRSARHAPARLSEALCAANSASETRDPGVRACALSLYLRALRHLGASYSGRGRMLRSLLRRNAEAFRKPALRLEE